MSHSTPDKASLLIEWMQKRSIWWNQELMLFAEATSSDDSAGIGLWAKKAVRDGDHLCTIPKIALLSVRNTDIADLLESERLGGGLALTFAVCFERARGKESPWCAASPAHSWYTWYIHLFAGLRGCFYALVHARCRGTA